MFKEVILYGAPRLVAISFARASALALSGCNTVVSDINKVTGALTSPQAQQAVANLKSGSQAFICAVNGVAVVYANVATAIGEGKAAIHDANTILVISSALCASLGGSVTGTAVVP